MVGKTAVVAAIAATSVVAIPYLTALACNIAYGWPQIKNKYRRAFNPKKVFALNIAVIQKMMTTIRYASLMLQWKSYYESARGSEILKDRQYGRNGQKLDLYFPKTRTEEGSGDDKHYPVVMFVHGGTWSSGDKNMYGLLCSTLANRLDVIVCCPSHSTYPKGFVDTMTQDLIDAIGWLQENVELYQGDKSKLMLIGHSSGAHLVALTMLELLNDQLSQSSSESLQPLTTSGLHFNERHFDDRSYANSDNEDRHSSGSSASFLVVSDHNENGGSNNEPSASSSITSSQFEVLSAQRSETEMSEASMLESELRELTQTESGSLRYRGTAGGTGTGSTSGAAEGGGEGAKGELGSLDVIEEDDDGVVTLKHIDSGDGEHIPLAQSQPTVPDYSQCVKAVIGIAGVYHIGDHFVHESKRGVEDVSYMTRAMRDNSNFDRVSPTHIVHTLTTPVHAKFPKIVLLHGTEDYVVPLSSTTKFSEEMQRLDADVTVRIIPSCDHYEICLDLMKPNCKFYDPVLNIIEDTAKSVFGV